MLNGSDGYIYIGGVSGSLVRLNPKNGEFKLLGKPCPKKRLSGLAIGPDGRLYGAGGDEGEATLFACDRQKEKIIILGPIYDKDLKTGAEKIHDIVVTDDLVVFCGENDNHTRSSYLWQCRIEK